MDELKLEKWKKNFNEEAQNMQVEFDSFFKSKELNDYYILKLDESQEPSLDVNDELPQELKERLQKLFIDAKPEDSV